MLKQLIKDEFDIDLDELIEKYSNLVSSGITDEHVSEIQAAVAVLSYSMSTHNTEQTSAAVLLLFAIGYQAGLDAPDLSAFKGVLEDGES